MNRQEKLAIIKEMIRLIAKGSHDMPNCIFTYYVNNKIPSEQKLFYNLIADSFLTLYSFSNLMKENCWSQAFAVLRMGIEQVSAVYLLTTIPESLQEYINLYALKVKTWKILKRYQSNF